MAGKEVAMFPPHTILKLFEVLVLAGLSFGLAIALGSSIRYRGKRVVKCPETKQPAAVHIDLTRLAREAIYRRPSLKLDQCSRWPERASCGQECLAEIKADPDLCLVWNMVDEWYEGKSCAYCQKPFGEIHWHERHPALLGPDRSIVQWNEVPAEDLPKIFQNYLPVCWNCYIAETFRRKNPERVVDRIWERGAGGEYVPKEHR